MNKKVFIIGAVATYGFLIMLLMLLNKKTSIRTPCTWYENCVRFCCSHSEKCNEKFIRSNFNASHLIEAENKDDEDKLNFRILFGRPTCSFSYIEPITNRDDWDFTKVRVIDKL